MALLLSGGLDSCVLLAHILDQEGSCHTISFAYGQRHAIELERAQQIASFYNVPHSVITIDKALFSTSHSSLIDTKESVHTSRGSTPSTYVPCRNLLFLSAAACYAESNGLTKIYIGATAEDQTQYPDCRKAFFSEVEKTLADSICTPIVIESPFIGYTKQEIVSLGKKLNAPMHISWSCYDPQGETPCNRCTPCRLRRGAFERLSQ